MSDGTAGVSVGAGNVGVTVGVIVLDALAADVLVGAGVLVSFAVAVGGAGVSVGGNGVSVSAGSVAVGVASGGQTQSVSPLLSM